MSKNKTTGELREKITHHYFEWKISKFSSLSSLGNSYKSQSFTFMNISWHLQVDVPNELFDYVTVSLINENKYPNPCDATVLLGIKQNDRTLIESKTDKFKNDSFVKFNFLNKTALQKEEIEYLPEGSLTIICTFKFDLVTEETLLPAAEANTLKKKPHRLTELDTLSENFKSLFVNKESCDVILKVQEKEFNAHKIILKARSSVFASMFSHDTLENQTGIVNIPDCDADSFHYFLEFLYCGKLEDITFQNALHLYSISDKYNVQKIKCFCVKYMEEYLTESNVCDVIVLADMYEESNLLNTAQDFFIDNAEKVTETIHWENLLKSNYRLANKFIKCMASKFKNVSKQASK